MLKQGFANLKKIKKLVPTAKPASSTLGNIGKLASSSLRNPDYPDYIHEITLFQPYLDLPFCLMVKQDQISDGDN